MQALFVLQERAGPRDSGVNSSTSLSTCWVGWVSEMARVYEIKTASDSTVYFGRLEPPLTIVCGGSLRGCGGLCDLCGQLDASLWEALTSKADDFI